MVLSNPISELLWILLEPMAQIVRFDLRFGHEHVDLVVTVAVESRPKFESHDVKAERFAGLLLAISDAVEEVILGPVVRVMFCDLFQELYT